MDFLPNQPFAFFALTQMSNRQYRNAQFSALDENHQGTVKIYNLMTFYIYPKLYKYGNAIQLHRLFVN